MSSTLRVGKSDTADPQTPLALHLGLQKVAPLRGLALWDYCHAFALTTRAGAMPTVGGYGLVRWHLPSEKIFCLLFHLWKSRKKKVGNDLLVPFPSLEKERNFFVFLQANF